MEKYFVDNFKISENGRIFYHCNKETKDSFNIPESVVEIGVESFAECKELRKLQISKKVHSIKIYALRNCISLVEIQIKNDRAKINVDEYAFVNVNKENCVIVVPENLIFAYRTDRIWGEFKNIIYHNESTDSLLNQTEIIQISI